MQAQQLCYPRTGSSKAQVKQVVAKLKRSTWLFLFTITIISLSNSYGQNSTGIIRGSVQTTGKESLSGINIKLDGTSYGATTNSEGNYEIKNIPAGKYTLIATAIGYSEEKHQVGVKAGDTVILNYQLNSQTNQLEQVTVTAERTGSYAAINKINVPIRDIPLTTSSVSSRTIEQRGIDDLGEAMKNTTGVRANNTYGGFQHFTVRGFSNFVLLIDGVRDERHNISTSAPSTNLANVERVEVLKGPASVLFGHSALGGIINIVRKQPTKEFKADFSAAYGSFNTRRMRAGAGGSISDKLRYRVDFGISETAGYRHFGTSTNNGYLALEYTPSSKDYFLLSIGANRDVYDTESGIPMLPGSKVPAGLNVNTRYNDPQDFLKNNRYDFQLKYVRQLTNNIRLSNQLSYYDDNINYFSTEELSLNATGDSITRSYPFFFNHLTKPVQNQLELTVDFNTGGIEQKLLAGYSVSILDRKTYNGDVYGPGLFATIPVKDPILNQGYLNYKTYEYRATQENVHGIYLQDWLRLSDKLKALVGVRFDIFRGTYFTNAVDADRNVTERGKKSEVNKSALTYRAGLVYQPIEPLSVYSSFSTYFKPSRRVAPNGETFDPEDGYQGEVGSRLEISKKWTGNLAFYYMRKNNQLESFPGGVFKRIGSAESKGFELELNGNPAPGLDVTAGYTFTKAKYLPHDGSEINAVAGNTTAFAPKNMLNVWLNYELQNSILKGLSIGAGANYMDETFTNSTNTYVLPAYTLVDAAIGYRVGRIGIRVNSNNLFNEKYFSNAIFASQFTPGATRNFLVTVRYSL